MHIKKLNESFVQLTFSDHIERGIVEDALTLYEPNFHNNTAYKKRFWNGKTKLFYKNDLYPLGLTYELRKISEMNGLGISLENKEDFRLYKNPMPISEFAELLDLPFTPFVHQFEALDAVYNFNKCIMKLGTNAGKTFITYILMRYMYEVLGYRKIVFIVPSSSLLKQAILDFKSYTNDRDYLKELTFVGSGYKIDHSKPLITGMWQSLQHFDDEWFEDVDAIIVDEAHKATAKELHGLVLKSINAKFKVGYTGSIPSNGYRLTKLKGIFAKYLEIIDGEELTNKGLSTPVEVDVLTINYVDEAFLDHIKNIAEIEDIDTTADDASLKIYQARIALIYSNPKRNKFISRELLSRDKNCVILFTNLDYAKNLRKQLLADIKKSGQDKQILYLDGEMNIKYPHKFKEYMEILEKNDNVILIATYKTFGTGVNNKNLYYLYYGQSTISEEDIIQTKGRLMRLKEGKDMAWIVDIVDDLPSLKGHSKTRLGYYEQEKLQVEHRSVDL